MASLLTGATVWGLIWYPFRLLEQAGLSGALATAASYGVALALGVILLWPRLRGLRLSPRLIPIVLTAGGCNMGYVLAVLHGEVMRVLLLFYLSPLWTVLFSRLLLGERLNSVGFGVVACSLLGAVIMLWHPDLGLPWPANGAEWVGVGAGMFFALQNVFVRKAAEQPVETRTLAVFAGVIGLGLAVAAVEPQAVPLKLDGFILLMLFMVGLVLLLANLVVQVGLAALPANRAIVILLSELVVAALSSWWLAGETMELREWLGGGLIVAASLVSGRMESPPERPVTA
ncbi:DMT family transporter [Denitratisoma sp. agr-D3]